MLLAPSFCSSNDASASTPCSFTPLAVKNTDLAGYQTLKALFQETRALIATSSISPKSVDLALKRCEVSEDRLERLLYDLGYWVSCEPDTLSNMVGWRIKRYLKRDEQLQLQTSYRDSIMLLRDIVLTNKIGAEVHYAGLQSTVQHLGEIPYAFETVVYFAESASKTLKARAMFDTGSDIEMVSKSFVIRNDLLGSVFSLENPRPVMGIGGVQTTVHESMNFKWQFMSNSPFRYVNCYVIDVDQNDFDILLGGKFLREHGLLVVQEPGRDKMEQTIPIPKVRMAGCGIIDGMKKDEQIRATELARKHQEREDKRQAGKRRKGGGPPPRYSKEPHTRGDLGIRDLEQIPAARPVDPQQVAQHRAHNYAPKDGRIMEHEVDSIQGYRHYHSEQQQSGTVLHEDHDDFHPVPLKKRSTWSKFMGLMHRSTGLAPIDTPGTTYSGTTFAGPSPDPSKDEFGPPKRTKTQIFLDGKKETIIRKWRKAVEVVIITLPKQPTEKMSSSQTNDTQHA